jgi:hypothetical protein
MIRFWGSKSRIGKRMSVAILELMQHYDLRYECVVECFCGIGGLSLRLNEILDPTIPFIASDKDFGVIGFLQAVQAGWSPRSCKITEAEFKALKATKEERTPMHMLTGHHACFNGKYFADNFQNYTNEKLAAGCRKIEKLRHLTYGIEFHTRDYQFYRPEDWKGCLFICDSPYRVIKEYYDCQLSKHFQSFDFDAFEAWVKAMSIDNYVICCEYSMGPDFVSIWEMETIHNNKTNLSKIKTEKLFVWNDPNSLFVRNAKTPTLAEWKHEYPGSYATLVVKSPPQYVNPAFGMQNVYFDGQFKESGQITLRTPVKDAKLVETTLRAQGLHVLRKA